MKRKKTFDEEEHVRILCSKPKRRRIQGSSRLSGSSEEWSAARLPLTTATSIFQFLPPAVIYGCLVAVCREWKQVIAEPSLSNDFTVGYMRNALRTDPTKVLSKWTTEEWVAKTQTADWLRIELKKRKVRAVYKMRKGQLVSTLCSALRTDLQLIRRFKKDIGLQSNDSALKEFDSALRNRSRILEAEIRTLCAERCQNCLRKQKNLIRSNFARMRLCKKCRGLPHWSEVSAKDCVDYWGVCQSDFESCGLRMAECCGQQCDWCAPALGRFVSGYVVATVALWKYRKDGRPLSSAALRSSKLRRTVSEVRRLQKESRDKEETQRLAAMAPVIKFTVPTHRLLVDDLLQRFM